MSLNPANAQYTVRAPWTPVYVRGRANGAALEVWQSGAQVVPTAATYALVDPSGTSVASGSATIAAGGTCSFALTSSHLTSTATLSTVYVETWTLTIATLSVVRERLVAVARRDWSMPCNDVDLTGPLASLSAVLPSGVTSFQTWLVEAWTQILGDLEAAGVFPQRVMNPGRFRSWHRHLTLALFYESCAMGQIGRGNWQELANTAHERAEKARAAAVVNLDADDDGKADDEGTLRSIDRGPVYMNAAPAGANFARTSARW